MYTRKLQFESSGSCKLLLMYTRKLLLMYTKAGGWLVQTRDLVVGKVLGQQRDENLGMGEVRIKKKLREEAQDTGPESRFRALQGIRHVTHM